jgi:TyrR family helix-turn-helix protein/PAS domain S-box-containing protein
MIKDQEELNEMETILHSLKDDILVTDVDGTILKVTETTRAIYGFDSINLVGQNIYDLEKDGVLTPIVTPIVIEAKRKVTIVQTTMNGKKLLVTGVPVFNPAGELWRVVSYSHDITELMQMQSYMSEMEYEVNRVKTELQKLREQTFISDGLIAKDPEMKKSMVIAEQVSEVDVSVLLLGESGVGKSLIAKYIHNKSPRRDYPFIEVNCGAIPNSLFEAEFFGYESGAFTDANKKGKVGLVELAEGGTLFLDEVGELSLEHQVKILKFIQEKTFYRVGGTRERKIDFRLIAATNQSLEQLVEERKFREDLYFRLNVVPITVPALRNRTADIIPLIHYFLDEFNKKYNRSRDLDEAVMQNLLNQGWKGNVRELMNLIERLVVTTPSPIIKMENLPDLYKQSPSEAVRFIPGQHTLKEIIERVESQVLQKAKSNYSTTVEMGKVLGISQPSIVRKLKKYNL